MKLRAACVFVVLILVTALTPAPAVSAPVNGWSGARGAAATGPDPLIRTLAAAARPLGRMLAAAGESLPDRLRDLLRLGGKERAPDGQAALPRRVQEPAAKPLKFKRVKELTGKRTARTRSFALEDGRVETELSAAPVNYRDASGTWQPIDTRIGTVDRPGFAYGSLKNGFGTLFGTRSDRLLRFEQAGRHVTVGLPGPARTLAPRVLGSQITYPAALGDGVDLVYQVTPEGVRKQVVLTRRPAEAAWTFTLALDGLDARPRPDGSIALVREGGEEPLFVLPKPFMVDATDDAASPYGKRYSDKVTQTISRRGADIQITVRADAAWLAAAERRYPVVVDPTIKIQPITWLQSLDVEIREDLPTTNLDNTWQLAVGTLATARVRSLVKFPLWDIPPGTQIDTASLQLYFDGSHTVSPTNSVTIEARRVTASWWDTDATWNSMNAAFAEAGLSTATRAPNQSAVWHSFNVKNIVQTWLNGTQPNHGFMLKAVTETLNQGGPIYEAAPGLASYGYDYGGETQNGPKLIVTYGRPSVTLNPPTKITATGAQLSWTAYADPSTSPNDDLVEYQVHRRLNGSSSTTPTCGPVSWSWCRYSSRVAVLPPGTTSFLDTSAPPTPADDPSPQGKAYDYWVVVKTKDGQASASGVQVAYLPKAGRTRVVIQGALDTTLSSTQATTGHDVLDGRAWLGVGNNSSTFGITRSLLKFDTTPVPTGATVQDADLSIWHPMTFGTAGANATYNLHKLTTAFNEAAASWNNATSTTAWTTRGGDFSATVLGSVSGLNNGEEPKWRTWRGANLTSTVQGWVATPSTNLGFLVKLANETTPAERSLFLSSEGVEPSLRPRLVVTYTEKLPESTYHAPATPERMAAGDTTTVPVTITNTTTQTLWGAGACPIDQYKASYFANTTLSGAPAGERCEGAIDNDWGLGGPAGVGVGADGFSVRWVKTQGFAAGTYTFSATADDGVRVFLDGVLLIDRWKDQGPTTYTVSRAVSAGDHELRMEYYESGGGAVARLGVTAGGAGCPVGHYQASYFANTTLSGTAAGQRCEAAIDNAWGSGGPSGVGVGADNFSVRWVKTQRFSAGTYTFTATADDGVRVFLDGVAVIDQWKDQGPTTYTAARSVTAGNHEVKLEYYEAGGDATARLRVTGAPSQLTYKWLLPDDSGNEDPASPASQLMTTLPRDLPPGNTVTVDASVKALSPADPTVTRNARVLTWDVYNPTTNTYLSAASGSAGVGGLGQRVGVERPTSDQLGLEKFYQYVGKNTGAGTAALVNQHAGNLVWSYDPITNPSRGPETFLRLTYNSLDTSNSAMGFGWSLSAASVMRQGTPLQFHPPGQDWPTTVRLTDGDGTTHTFTLNKHGSTDPANWDYDHPFGVHLYLQKLTTGDPARAWRMTHPDRTEFLFDEDGYQSASRDNNGNELLFTYERRKSNNKPIKFLKYLTDAATRQTLTLTHYAKGQSYDYYDSTTNQRLTASNLTNPHIIDQVQTITDVSNRQLKLVYSDKGLLKELVDGVGSTLAKTFLFDYDMTQGNKNVKLVKVTDPRGHATDLAYYSPPNDDPKFHWWAKTITDRLGNPTGFAYVDPDGPQGEVIETTVTDAEQHATFYRTDAFGRPDLTRDAKQQQTSLVWDADHNVTRLTEDNGAFTTWTYDPKTGFPLTITDAQANADGTPGTTLTYQTSLNGFVAELTEKRSPEGRTWRFGYDAFGNLTSVTDPKGVATPADPNDFVSRYEYDTLGQLSKATDANEHATLYSGFDANGYPQTITDARGKPTVFTYDVRGNVLTVKDARLKTTSQTYDLFGRPLERRVPKNEALGEFIITPAPDYDRNDNVTRAIAPNGAVTTGVYDDADQVTSVSLPKDDPGDPARTRSYTYDKVGNLRTETEPKGNLTADPGDFVTTNTYDEIYQLTAVVNAKNERLTYAYDNVGNVITVVDPRKSASTDPSDYTTKYEYDRAHRVLRVVDAAGHSVASDYDLDGNVVATTDQNGNTAVIDLDERAKPRQVRVPHDNPGGTVSYRTTQYEYDEVGNRTKVVSPRGVESTTDPDDFAYTSVYDEVNQVKEELLPFDRDDSEITSPDRVIYSYDDVGNLTQVSAPPSAGQTVRNINKYTYLDNGWVKTVTDPWDIVTTYEYNPLGQQTSNTTTSAGGSSSRSMSWTYFPDGKLATRSDDGVPAGLQVVLVDNSDSPNVAFAGTWPTATSGSGFQGFDYRTHAAGTGTATFTWKLHVPQSGTYAVFARYPSGATATNAPYKVEHSAGSTTKAVNQTAGAGTWVSLGSFTFTEGDGGAGRQVVLSDAANGSVVADAVKLVRDNSADPPDGEFKRLTYKYDPNGNLVATTDASSGAKVDTYTVDYDGLNRVEVVTERNGGVTGTPHKTTRFTYDPNGNPDTRTHDDEFARYTYDARDQTQTASSGKSASDPDPKVTRFTYTPRGQKLRETKANNNTVDYTYFLDGLLKTQVEKKANGTLVSSHTIDYDANGHRISDVTRKQNADNHAAYLDHTFAYVYDPRDRIRRVTKSATGGGVLETETYTHDANNNITRQNVENAITDFTYDRNRLMSSTTAGVTASYNYDPFGRLDKVTANGILLERYTYDGFDRVLEHRKPTSTGGTTTTRYAYDPLDRTASRIENPGAAGEKKTDFSYLGLSDDVLSEAIAGDVQKSYQYSPWGQRLSQVKFTPGGEEDSFYGYSPHTDVETLTNESGDTRATYGYTAYGKDDKESFTGVDKPDAANPTKEPYNFYRFNAKRFDPATGDYDMGFRDYDPGLNRYLSRDLYNGALADLNLSMDPWNANRYAFAGGNPITFIELDGHFGWNDVTSFISEHKEEIIGAAVGFAVGVGCTAVTAGAGALGCAALGGAVGSMVTHGMTTDEHTVGGYLGAGALGAASGVVGYGAGKLLSPIARRGAGMVKGFLGRGDDLASGAGGGGGGNVASRFVQSAPSSRTLRENMEATGQFASGNFQAHHIVSGKPWSGRNAAVRAAVKRAQDKLTQLGIDINDAANGVYLPGGKAPSWHTKAHINDYLTSVSQRLAQARTRDEGLAILRKIGQELHNRWLISPKEPFPKKYIIPRNII